MKVIYKDYIMEASTDGGFHLRKKAIVPKTIIVDGKKTTNGETHEREQTLGYNMRISSCIKKIIHLNHCSRDEVVELKDYVKIYQEAVKDLQKLINI